MQTLYSLLRTVAFLLLIASLPVSCMKDKLTKTFAIYAPVFKAKSEVLASVKVAAPQAVTNPGKIYMYGKHIFLNEVNKGVHIIDNSNTATPRNIGFINIPGNVDIAVKGNILYADMYSDLLTIDISNPASTKLLKNIPKVFPERNFGVGVSRDSNLVLIDWVRKDTTIDINSPINSCANCMFEGDFASMSNKSSSSGPAGLGGSMARFTIVNDHLYTVGESNLTVFSIANSADPIQLGKQSVGMNIETIYPFKNKLFVGSATGMFIYNINSPASPERESQFQHARACDPVIADDNFAFVTLRTGAWCGGGSNILDIIDVSTVALPRLVKTYQFKNPHGLAKDGNLLFICDGADGLKMYDASDVYDLKLLDHVKGIETFDAIAWNNIILVVSQNGLNQYDYSNGKTLKLLSTIEVTKKS